jgi:PAS domain S-box-containing protein
MNTAHETLNQHKEEILQSWEAEVRQTILSSRDEPQDLVRDNIPIFLDSLSEKLKTRSPELNNKIREIAKHHGTLRATFTRYTIEEAIAEYNILRKVIFDTLAKHEPTISQFERDAIFEAIYTGLVMAATEFNELKQNQLTSSEEKFKKLFNNAPVGMAEINTHDMSFNRVNPVYCKMTGYTEEELLKLKVVDITHPDDLQGDALLIEEIRQGKRSQYKREKRYICKNGNTIWVEVTATYNLDEMNDPFNIAVAIDITERKRAEGKVTKIIEDLRKYQAKLETTSRQLQMITDIQPFLIGQLDTDLKYVFVNEAYEVWFKLRRDQIIGKHIRDILGVKFFKEVEPHLLKALSGKKEVFEIKATYKETPKMVQCTYSPGFDSYGKIDSINISVIDITDLKMALESLKEETEIRQKFMSTLSHDLRTPLTAAKLSADIISMKITDESIKKYSARISESLQRVNLMIEDLLDVSKIRAGQNLQAEIQEFNLIEIVRKTLDDLCAVHGDRFLFCAPERLVVHLDQNGIRRILENLCSNAIKYGWQDEKIEVVVLQDNKKVSLSVMNKGKNLTDSEKEKFFQPFQRGSEESTAGKKGWGIGLTIVKGIVDALKGHIEVSSHSNETTFKVILPLDATDAIQN